MLDGQVTYRAGTEELVATTGDFVWIPRGTVHSFRVDAPTATLLNCYSPAGFEQVLIQQGIPAGHFELPTQGLTSPVPPEALLALFQQMGMHPVPEADVLRPGQPPQPSPFSVLIT